MSANPWRPIVDLDHDGIVEFRLPVNGGARVVVGCMLVGGVHPGARTYYFRNREGALQFCRPDAWRETPWADVEIMPIVREVA